MYLIQLGSDELSLASAVEAWSSILYCTAVYASSLTHSLTRLSFVEERSECVSV
jgi:hypothetical protein